MKEWLKLTRKELRLGMPAVLLSVILYILIAGIASFIGYRNGVMWEALGGVTFVSLLVMTLYIVFYLLYSLQTERKKLHLWLHNPMPGYGMLLSKLSAGLVSMIAVVLLLVVVLTVAVNLSEYRQELTELVPWLDLIDFGLFAGVHFFLLALQAGMIFLFFWVIFLVLTRFMGSFLSFLTVFILFVFSVYLNNWFGTTILYDVLTKWGEFHITGLIEGMSVSTDMESLQTEVIRQSEQVRLYAGVYVYEILVTVVLFAAASWMIDQKVEV